jgi:hypothetical protein
MLSRLAAGALGLVTLNHEIPRLRSREVTVAKQADKASVTGQAARHLQRMGGPFTGTRNDLKGASVEIAVHHGESYSWEDVEFGKL